MTKKDFIAIARIIRETDLSSEDEWDLKRIMAEEFASFLRTTNPRFDSTRFRQACKPLAQVEKESRLRNKAFIS